MQMASLLQQLLQLCDAIVCCSRICNILLSCQNMLVNNICCTAPQQQQQIHTDTQIHNTESHG